MEIISQISVTDIIKIIFPAIVTYMVTSKMKKFDKSHEINSKILELAYAPIFKKIEPFLYKRITHEEATNIIRGIEPIITEKYEFISGRFIACFRRFSQKVEKMESYQEDYELMCAAVDREFENLRKTIGLPKRRLVDKWNLGEFRNQTQEIVNHILLKAAHFIYIVTILTILILVTQTAVEFVGYFIDLF